MAHTFGGFIHMLLIVVAGIAVIRVIRGSDPQRYSPLLHFPSLAIYKRNLLKAQVGIGLQRKTAALGIAVRRAE